jgi:hypothetical protein
MPPPMTSMRFGTVRNSSAPVESTMRGSCRNKRQIHDGRAGGDDRLFELDGFLAAVCCSDFNMVRADKLADALHDIDLAHLGHAGKTCGHLADDFFLVAAQLVDIDLWFAEGDAMRGHRRRFIDDGSNVQQGFRWNATDIQADAAKRCVAFDQNGGHAEIGGAECSRVTAWAGAENHHVAFDIGFAGEAGGGRQRIRRFRLCRRCCCRRCRSGNSWSWRWHRCAAGALAATSNVSNGEPSRSCRPA